MIYRIAKSKPKMLNPFRPGIDRLEQRLLLAADLSLDVIQPLVGYETELWSHGLGPGFHDIWWGGEPLLIPMDQPGTEVAFSFGASDEMATMGSGEPTVLPEPAQYFPMNNAYGDDYITDAYFGGYASPYIDPLGFDGYVAVAEVFVEDLSYWDSYAIEPEIEFDVSADAIHNDFDRGELILVSPIADSASFVEFGIPLESTVFLAETQSLDGELIAEELFSSSNNDFLPDEFGEALPGEVVTHLFGNGEGVPELSGTVFVVDVNPFSPADAVSEVVFGGSIEIDGTVPATSFSDEFGAGELARNTDAPLESNSDTVALEVIQLAAALSIEDSFSIDSFVPIENKSVARADESNLASVSRFGGTPGTHENGHLDGQAAIPEQNNMTMGVRSLGMELLRKFSQRNDAMEPASREPVDWSTQPLNEANDNTSTTRESIGDGISASPNNLHEPSGDTIAGSPLPELYVGPPIEPLSGFEVFDIFRGITTEDAFVQEGGELAIASVTHASMIPMGTRTQIVISLMAVGSGAFYVHQQAMRRNSQRHYRAAVEMMWGYAVSWSMGEDLDATRPAILKLGT